MVHPAHAFVWVLAAAAIFAIARLHLWRALLFFRPEWMRIAPLPSLAPTSPAALEKATALLQLGFRPLGGHRERAPLGPAAELLDFAHPGSGTFASLAPTRRGVQLILLSRLGNGGFVLSADHFRPVGGAPGLHIAGVPGWKPERLFRAHQKRVEITDIRDPHPHPSPGGRGDRAVTLEERIEAAREWYRGAGAHEVRALHLSGLLWVAGTVGLVAWVLLG